MVFHHPAAAVGGSQLYQPATSAVGLGVGENCGEVHFGWLISGQFEEEVWKKAQKKVEELSE